MAHARKPFRVPTTIRSQNYPSRFWNEWHSENASSANASSRRARKLIINPAFARMTFPRLLVSARDSYFGIWVSVDARTRFGEDHRRRIFTRGDSFARIA